MRAVVVCLRSVVAGAGAGLVSGFLGGARLARPVRVGAARLELPNFWLTPTIDLDFDLDRLDAGTSILPFLASPASRSMDPSLGLFATEPGGGSLEADAVLAELVGNFDMLSFSCNC